MFDIKLLREQLMSYMRKNISGVTKLAEDIGISHVTLMKFIRSEGNPIIPTVLKIERFLKERETN